MPPPLPPVHSTTIEVEEGFLPAPATRLVVTQYLESSQDPPFWAWIIVGAFLDRNDRVLWSTEVFVGHLDLQFESDDEDSLDYPAFSDLAEVYDDDDDGPDGEFIDFLWGINRRRDADDNHNSSQVTSGDGDGDGDGDESVSDARNSEPPGLGACTRTPSVEPLSEAETPPTWHFQLGPIGYINPPTNWDPTRHGPVPGYWQASFDHASDRWVHTWQPFL